MKKFGSFKSSTMQIGGGGVDSEPLTRTEHLTKFM